MSHSFDPKLKHVYPLPAVHSWLPSRHRFDEESVWAIRAALVTGRPLLVRGEAGIGKSQLARAAANVLDVPFLYHVIQARCEPTDLLYTYDAVSRLAQAQVLGAPGQAEGWAAKLAEERFIRPGVLWWAFDWADARDQAKRACRNPDCAKQTDCCKACGEPDRPARSPREAGCVVLIDEIDKAESDLPNGLLESLGNTGFQVPQLGHVVKLADPEHPPLIVVTTNEERELPAAFLRRCLVLQIRLGKTDAEQRQFLRDRARDHAAPEQISEALLDAALDLLLKDRADAPRLGPA
ncbi:MAG: AAA family ATPase, partial [Limisphaerales bacterium]